MFDFSAHFDGVTYDPALDKDRLKRQIGKVYEYMRDGLWHSLADIGRAVDAPEASVSARLRDLRKAKFGGHTVERRRFEFGMWKYRLYL